MALGSLLVLAWVALAAQAGTVFNDSFEPNGITPATRNDDAGTAFGPDIQWRPRLGNQAGSYSVVTDQVLGNALLFTNSATYLMIIGQFDADTSNDITPGANSDPVSLGPNVGDTFSLSLDIRTTTTIPTGDSFKIGLELDPDGPLATDPGTDNSWINNSQGYYISIPNGTAGLVATSRESGTDGSSPFSGSDTTQLSGGITGVTAALGADTNHHTLLMQFTRVAPASLQVDSYWDGLLVSTATDTSGPFASFNSIIMRYAPVTGYVFDNVKGESLSGAPINPVAQNPSHVAIGGGGYITGLIIHPQNPDVAYARTDVGGAYRWDPGAPGWIPLLDWIAVGDVNLYGVESIAIDPSDTHIVYLSCGKNFGSNPRGIYKSTDRGATWHGLYLTIVRTSSNDGISGGRAEPFVRNAGERLVVDPNNGSILYFGSRADGLWKSINAGVSWTQVSIPNPGAAGYGVSFVAFDGTSGSPGTGSSNIWIGVFGSSAGGTDGGVYRSSDAGSSWSRLTNPISGNVNQPRRGQCSPVDGALWVTHQAGVARAAATASGLTDITPAAETGLCYNGLALDPTNASKAVVVRGEVTSNAPIYRTANTGGAWSKLSPGTHASSVPWWSSGMWGAWVSACAINPAQPNQLWYGDWYGVWRTEDYTSGSPVWHNYEKGHEEVVVFTLSCPPGPSADLLSGCADVEGFRHTNVNTFPPFSFGNAPGNGSGCNLQAAFGLDYCETNPSFIVRASGSEDNGTMAMCKSVNNGASWTLCPGWSSTNQPRRVAVSASNPNVFLTIRSAGKPMVTSDGGSTFITCGGITENGPTGPWETAQPLAADRVDGTKFYYYIAGKLYRSTDSGGNFTVVNTTLPSSTPNLKAMPGINGRLVLSLMGSGLWQSTNSGANFTEIRSPLNARINARAMGLGRPATGSNSWIYIYGTIDGVEGCHYSQDAGATWSKIDTGSVLMGCGPNIVEASRQIVGRVYIGTSGRGIFQLDVPPPPRLAITPTATGLNVSWPAGALFNLYSAPSLTPPLVWTPESGSLVLSNSRWNFAAPVTNATSRFYRLQ